MFVFIVEIIKIAIQFIADLLSGELPGYFYIWCGVFLVYAFIYACLEMRTRLTAAELAESFFLECASHLAGWIIGILAARVSVYLIEDGISQQHKLALYKIGLLLLISYDFSAIFSSVTNKAFAQRNIAEICAFIVGMTATYLLFMLCRDSILQGLILSQTYVVTLSILSGIFTLLYKISLRSAGAPKNSQL
ncbi:DUF5823 family protein [Paenibacillus graminis]|uniref:DUF5823 family protein n=1 Tax=Paenibacillus graminis TaxID=189425 RepID=UPI002DB87D5D|nr:DUF5823 family protein [Paenibacillus graminis]MEC0167928.1 DUF5823 family protein [Paenibacillus graminis]